MQPINQERVLEQTDLLAGLISEQEEVKMFQKAEALIKKNNRIQELITEIKRKQQELVNAKHLKKKNYVKALENELDELNKELHDIPLVRQYQQMQADLNKYLQSIIKMMKDQLSTNIPIEKD